jgi:hypothetical protein
MNAPPSPPVVAVKTCGPLSGSAERCLMHLKRLQSELKESESAAQYRVLVQHDDAHAIIVLHVDSSSCTPVVGGGVAVDSLHCTVQVPLLSYAPCHVPTTSEPHLLIPFSVHAPISSVSLHPARRSGRCLPLFPCCRWPPPALACRLLKGHPKQRHKSVDLSCRLHARDTRAGRRAAASAAPRHQRLGFHHGDMRVSRAVAAAQARRHLGL